jgi:Domain of unknown function (DUF5753)
MTEPLKSPDPRSGMWAWLAYELRFQRIKHDLKLREASQIASVGLSTFSNWEAGRRRPDTVQCRVLDEAWQTGGLLERIHWYARTAHDPDWFGQYLLFEAQATVIRIFEVSWIPGLLQTEEYARAVLVASGSAQLDDQVASRMARQELLTKPSPPSLWVILDESVIRRPIGGRDVMRSQLSRLLELSERPNVFVRVVPLSVGAHVGLNGPFMVMRHPDGDVAFTEASIGGRLVRDTSGVQDLGLQFDRIGVDALSRDATHTMINEAMDGLR